MKIYDDDWTPDWISEGFVAVAKTSADLEASTDLEASADFEALDSDVDLDLPFLEPSPYAQIESTLDNIINAIQVFAKPRDYSMTKLRTKPHKPSRFGVKIEIMYIRYFKGNKILKSKATKRKREATQMTKCSFAIVARENKGVWKLTVNKSNHNHDLTPSSAHSTHRRQTIITARKDQIKLATKNGVKSRQILNALRGEEGSECAIKIIDIYNTKHELRREILGNLISTQALAMIL